MAEPPYLYLVIGHVTRVLSRDTRVPTVPVDVVVHVPLHVPAEHGGALVIQRLRQLHSVTEEARMDVICDR